MTLFDEIGETYDGTRQADERIVTVLTRLLHLASGATIADIGAGTGNYTLALAEAGFKVMGVEPSSGMRIRGRFHPGIEWVEGFAEKVPLPDAGVEGVISTLAVCHFSDVPRAIREMVRICRTGRVVIFTFDREIGRQTWLYEYFPFMWDTFNSSPLPSELADMLGRAAGVEAKVAAFPLPHDLKDNFAAAGWRTPHRYLNEGYRANISSFWKAEPSAVALGVARLAEDLASGVWNHRYGTILEHTVLDAGYRFIFTCPNNKENAEEQSCI